MGTFVDVFRHEPLRLEHKDRFKEQAKVLMKQGGLMQEISQNLFGRTFRLLAWPDFHTYEYDFGRKQTMMIADYSLFEGRGWEETVVYADPDFGKAAVFSGKVGWGPFAEATLALHILEGLYSDYTSWASLNVLGFEEVYDVQCWIHTLFDDVPNKPFLSFWLFYRKFGDPKEELVFRSFEGQSMFAAVGFLDRFFEAALEFWQTAAAYNGIESALHQVNEIYNSYDKEEYDYPDDLFNESNKALEQIFEKSENQGEAVFDALMILERFFCELSEVPENEDEILDNEVLRQAIPVLDNLIDVDVVRSALIPSEYPLPVFVLAKCCELTCRDFWKEYEKNPWIEDYFIRMSRRKAEAILKTSFSTRIFFGLDAGRLLALWSRENPLSFDKELQSWFAALNRRYFMLVEKLEKKPLQNPARKICSIMERAEKEDPKAIVFQDFFEETLNHMGDPAWMAYWILFEELAESLEGDAQDLDPSLKAAANRPYVLRDYAALTGNPDLRECVFAEVFNPSVFK